MALVGLVLGVVVIVTAWFGLVATFVLPRGRSFFQRLPTRTRRIVFGAFKRLSRLHASYDGKDALLAAAGPAALIVQLALFLALLEVGFALILWRSTHDLGSAFGQAASGLFTLGLADAGQPTNEAATVLAAASGSVTIALQIGYLPVIYQSYTRRESLVALMESRAGVPAWGPEVLMRHQLVTSTDALPDFYAQWELWSADLAESHGTHPVLTIFRSAVPGYSWLLSLLAVLDAAALQLALFPSSAPVEARMCLRMGFSALRRLAWTLRWDYDRDPSPDDPIQLTFAEFTVAVDLLTDAGFELERSPEEAWAHFRGWRINYESIAYGLADYLVAPHAPWSGPRRWLSADVVLPDRPAHRSPTGRTIPDGYKGTYRTRFAAAHAAADLAPGDGSADPSAALEVEATEGDRP